MNRSVKVNCSDCSVLALFDTLELNLYLQSPFMRSHSKTNLKLNLTLIGKALGV